MESTLPNGEKRKWTPTQIYFIEMATGKIIQATEGPNLGSAFLANKTNRMFVSRKEKSVTRASILVAYKKAQELGCVTGPKQLGVFGASYLYPVFLRLGIICASAG